MILSFDLSIPCREGRTNRNRFFFSGTKGGSQRTRKTEQASKAHAKVAPNFGPMRRPIMLDETRLGKSSRRTGSATYFIGSRLRGPGPGPADLGSGAKMSRLPRDGARARRRNEHGRFRLPRARARGCRLLVAPEPRTAGPGPREPGNFGAGASGSVLGGLPRPAGRASNLDGFAINPLFR